VTALSWSREPREARADRWELRAFATVVGARPAPARNPHYAFNEFGRAPSNGPRALRPWAEIERTKVVARFGPSVRPRGVQLFSGVIRAEHLSRWSRALFRLLGCRFGDYRDWAAIDAWADALFEELAGIRAAA
jgi:hypothetical protein